MSELSKNLMVEIENYLMDIIDTSIKFIPYDKQKEYLNSIIHVTRFHKSTIELMVKSNEK